jgi:hypothetical protein
METETATITVNVHVTPLTDVNERTVSFLYPTSTKTTVDTDLIDKTLTVIFSAIEYSRSHFVSIFLFCYSRI